MKKIKLLTIKIWMLFNSLIYFFLKILKTQNKITFISRQTNKQNIDFELIIEQIKEKKPTYKIVILNKKIEKGILNEIKYSLHMFRQMYHIATSKAVILDGYCIAVSNLKHKNDTVIIQLWHASGAIKRFGYQALDKKEGRNSVLAKTMNMHKNYSIVVAPSKATAKIYSEAFGINEEQIVINGLPRMDYILDGNMSKGKLEKFYNEYSNFQDKSKKVILYVPTFRQKNHNPEKIKELIKSINYSKYNLIIKLHPLDKNKALVKNYTVSNNYNTYDLLKIADYVITDYSAVAFEASLLNKPLFFYVYDIDEYEDARGLNINLFEEMKSSTSKNIKEIIHLIENKNYEYDELIDFRKKYIENEESNNTLSLLNVVFNYIEKDNENEKAKNNINESSKEKLNA